MRKRSVFLRLPAYFLQSFACVRVVVGLSPRHLDGPACGVHLFLPIELLVALVLFLLPQAAGELLVACRLHLEPVAIFHEDMNVLFVFQLDLLARFHLLVWMRMGRIMIEVH